MNAEVQKLADSWRGDIGGLTQLVIGNSEPLSTLNTNGKEHWYDLRNALSQLLMERVSNGPKSENQTSTPDQTVGNQGDTTPCEGSKVKSSTVLQGVKTVPNEFGGKDANQK